MEMIMAEALDFENSIAGLTGAIHELIYRRLTDCFKEAKIPLTAYQYQLMIRLWKEDGLHQTTLAKMLDRDRSALTHMIDVLEKKGLANRKKDKNDKRAFCINLTSKGKKLENTATQCAEKTLKEALAGLDEQRYAELVVALHQIRSNLKQATDGLRSPDFIQINRYPVDLVSDE
jgi:DNA-binding MarR family transcriptional regulator